jgi:nucleoside-diphosphate-sugar epimerase
MSKIILLGGTGFLGKVLLSMLQKENFKTITLVHETNPDIITDIFSGDICKMGILDSQLDDDDIIINLIGQYEENLAKFVNTNVHGAFSILNSVSKKKNIKIILISSISVYGENLEHLSKEFDELHPKSIYGIVKLVTEKIFENYSIVNKTDTTILRMSTLYGPNKKTGHIVNLIKSINNHVSTVAYNNGNQIRDLLFVNDAARGIIQSIKKPQKGFNIFNISSAKQYKILDIIKIIESISKKKLPVKFSDEIPDEKRLCADNSLAEENLDFIPKTSIEDGLKITIEHFQKNSP